MRISHSYGLPRWLSKESTCQCRGEFSPWVGKISWKRKWQPTPVLFFFFNFELEDNCFTILCWFLPYINIISHRYTYVPSLLHRLTPLGCHRAPVLSCLHTANFHWLSILHMAIHMLPCYSLPSSHTLLLPPGSTSLFSVSGVSIAALQRGSSVPSF